MSSRRSSDEPVAKRQKVYRACLGCVNSKTRCEDVTPEGCLRCRNKRKDCSLIESGIDLPNSTYPGPPFAAEWEARMEAAEKGCNLLSNRVERLERALRSTATDDHPSVPHPGSTYTPALTPALTPIARPVGVSALFTARMWTRVPLSEAIFNLSTEEGYPDPVSKGLVTLEQMEMAFHLFKYRFSKIIPLVPFISSSATLPAHAFLRVAILAFTNPTAAHAGLLEESILAVSAGAVSSDVVLALFVMSLAPSPPDVSRAPMTPLRMISLAYSVGQAMGMDAQAELGIRSKWIGLPEWTPRLDQFLMWEAVKNRYNILTMMQGRHTYLAKSLIGSLPLPQLSEYHPCVKHLKLEAEMVSIFEPLLHETSLAEVAAIDDVPDMQRILNLWTPIGGNLEKLAVRIKDSKAGLFRFDAESLRFSLAFRLSSLSQKTPTPINGDLRVAGQSFTGINLIKYGLSMCELFNTTPAPELLLLPCYLVMEFAIALAVERRSVAYMKREGQSWEVIKVDRVDLALSRMMEVVGGLPATLLQLTEDPILDSRVPDFDFNVLFGTLPDDWLHQFGMDQDWSNMGTDWTTPNVSATFPLS